MNMEVELPELGDGEREQASVSEWRFEEGDLVLEDEVLLEVTTDHETHEVHCPATGILTERLVDEDDVVRVGDVVAIIEVTDEDEEEVGEESFGIDEE
jgi:2-oxoglutarate dehydrogenase E2 component (dihydrolipoamide succinyltransferase)